MKRENGSLCHVNRDAAGAAYRWHGGVGHEEHAEQLVAVLGRKRKSVRARTTVRVMSIFNWRGRCPALFILTSTHFLPRSPRGFPCFWLPPHWRTATRHASLQNLERRPGGSLQPSRAHDGRAVAAAGMGEDGAATRGSAALALALAALAGASSRHGSSWDARRLPAPLACLAAFAAFVADLAAGLAEGRRSL